MSKEADNDTKYFSLDKKVVGYKTYESWTSVPHVTFIYEADATDFLAAFYKWKVLNPNMGITINTLLLKICVEAIAAAPQVNAHIKYNPQYVTGRIDVKKNIDISIPWLLDNGNMVTINLRNFESKSLIQMQEYINKTSFKIKNCDIYIPMYQVSVNNMLGELKKGHLLKAVRALLGAAFGKSQTVKYGREEIEAYKKSLPKKKLQRMTLSRVQLLFQISAQSIRSKKDLWGF